MLITLYARLKNLDLRLRDQTSHRLFGAFINSPILVFYSRDRKGDAEECVPTIRTIVSDGEYHPLHFSVARTLLPVFPWDYVPHTTFTYTVRFLHNAAEGKNSIKDESIVSRF